MAQPDRSLFEELKRANAAIKRLTENGPGSLYIIAIQCLSTLTFLLATTATQRQRKLLVKQKSTIVDLVFAMWFFLLNSIFMGLFAYGVWRRWLPAVPGRVFGSLFVGFAGTFLGVAVEVAASVGDKGVTRNAINGEVDGYKARMWMHTCISIVVSVGFLIILTIRSK
jgi:hypothetical protein